MRRPVGRPIGSSGTASTGAPEAGNLAPAAATHTPLASVVASSPRLTAAALAGLAARLDERDRAILRTLATFRLARGGQLRRLHLPAVDPRSARRTLARLQDLQLIARLERQIGGKRAGSDGSLYQLTSAGMRLARPGSPARSPWSVSTRFQDHILAVTELYVGLSEVHRARCQRFLKFDPLGVREM
ncbi:replication-relaxation family protein [Frankia sp. AgW1.1]|uniref:replication-relaxation family protein n=1 Tax=Frankia sp. AgW1.1 TaxID=1836971 RepID=UPI0035ABA0ED